ncbi:MAG: 3-deoxy-manno-octulosonate cytidylyltransferase, partial [Planctomycetota bacterium]|nr:3-deoxy-manno-octulosonate cytidylyltransferase [Planctomycetota bacterium]
MTHCGRRILVVIPARFGSTRLPAKPLLRETGKYLIQHVYERVLEARLDARVVVATDDERIAAAVREFGGEPIMTSRACRSGTDRACEVACASRGAEIVVNVQGDEPEIEPRNIRALVALMGPGQARARAGPERKRGSQVAANALGVGSGIVQMATLACPLADLKEFLDPSKVKVVLSRRARTRCGALRGFGEALYFSRAPIPRPAGAPGACGSAATPPRGALRHLGIYAYRREVLLRFASLTPSSLEETERLEQLRAMENGIPIRVGIVEKGSVGIDTPADYRSFVRRYAEVASHGVQGKKS